LSWTLWHSDEVDPRWFLRGLQIGDAEVSVRRLPPSDAASPRDFHRLPTHIKNILYLDCPDIIVEWGNSPVLAIEISEEAGTGHNAFQRFGRIVAAAEAGVPVLYVYPEHVWVQRMAGGRWDTLNPLLCVAMEEVSRVHGIPVLLYRYPTHRDPSRPGAAPPPGTGKGLRKGTDGMPDPHDPEIREMFTFSQAVLSVARSDGRAALARLIHHPLARDRRNLMAAMVPHRVRQAATRGTGATAPSPLSSCTAVKTADVLQLLRHLANLPSDHDFGVLATREHTVIYHPDADPRPDPYAGALAALDYLRCRAGPTYEDRHTNLAIAWGKVSLHGGGLTIGRPPSRNVARNRSIEKFLQPVRELYTDSSRVLLGKQYRELHPHEIPRYFMQLRFGTTFTKTKLVRMLAHLCDAVIFWDGALWREG